MPWIAGLLFAATLVSAGVILYRLWQRPALSQSRQSEHSLAQRQSNALIGVTEEAEIPVSELQARADGGDTDAMIQLALRYNYGPGVEYDLAKTQHFIIKAAKAGNYVAEAICHYYAWGGYKKDLAAAFALLDKGVKAGQEPRIALRHLGRCYEHGWGVAQDPVKAIGLYQRAADSGDPAADEVLAECYLNGVGCEKNGEKAIKILKKYEDRGYWVQLLLLGNMYAYGRGGLTRNAAKAESLYLKAAAAGYPDALSRLLDLRINTARLALASKANGGKPDLDGEDRMWTSTIAEGQTYLRQHPESLAIRFTVANMIVERGKDGPVEASMEALDLCAAAVSQRAWELNDSQMPLYLRWLAGLFPTTGEKNPPPRAQALLEQARGFQIYCFDVESKMSMASVLLSLANRRLTNKQFAEALALGREALALDDHLLEKESYQWHFRRSMADAEQLIAQCARELHDDWSEFDARRAFLRIWGVPQLGIEENGLLDKNLALNAENLAKLRDAMTPLPVMKSLTMKCDVNGIDTPVQFSIANGLNAAHECQAIVDQVEWIRKERGITAPVEVIKALKDLGAIAYKEHVSFVDLVAYAMDEKNSRKASNTPGKPAEAK